MTARPPNRLAAVVMALVLAALLAGCAASVIPPVHSGQERLALARRMMDQRRWAAAIELLQGYVTGQAGSADVDEAIYLLGECRLQLKEWPLAAVEFERLIRDYPESDSTPSASFRLGEALFGQSRPPAFDQEYTHRAIGQWEAYLSAFPGHWLNAEAGRRLALARGRLATKLLNTGNLYLKLKLTEPARVYFERVLSEHGDSILAGDARIGLALCAAREGRTDEAIERLRAVEQELSGQPAAERAARERARLEKRRG